MDSLHRFYEQKIEECERMAAQASDPLERIQWLGMAEQWRMKLVVPQNDNEPEGS